MFANQFIRIIQDFAPRNSLFWEVYQKQIIELCFWSLVLSLWGTIYRMTYLNHNRFSDKNSYARERVAPLQKCMVEIDQAHLELEKTC